MTYSIYFQFVAKYLNEKQINAKNFSFDATLANAEEFEDENVSEKNCLVSTDNLPENVSDTANLNSSQRCVALSYPL